jgi:uncharacterized protein YecE (DUF72 family)
LPGDEFKKGGSKTPGDFASQSKSEYGCMAARCLVGTSGWNYKHWAGGVFYPAGMKPSNWLDHYGRCFDSVEINNSFYRLPEKRTFQKWYEIPPENFAFAVKASRFITHMKRLANPEDHLPPFLENASALKKKLGVILFQLPPYWKFNKDRLEKFFHFLSRQQILPGLRSALEVRHKSWICEACFDVLRKYDVSLALADWPGLSVEGPLTASFVFIRRHGPGSLYASNYSDAHLKRDAQKIRLWIFEGKDVYLYYNNDAYGYAVKNALTLKTFLDQGS